MSVFEDQAFDVAIDGNCFHCIIGSERAGFLADVLRTLKVGGCFLLSSMCGPPRSCSVRQSYDAGLRCLIRNGVPWRFMPSPESLAQECKAAGFDLVRADLKENPWWDHVVMLLRRPWSEVGPARASLR